MAGTRTKRTDPVRDRLLAAVALGSTLKMACASAGISEATLSRWTHDDEHFASALARAKDATAVAMLERITQASQKDYRAAVEWLQRLYPDHFGIKQKVEQDVSVSFTLQIPKPASSLTVIEGQATPLLDAPSTEEGPPGV